MSNKPLGKGELNFWYIAGDGFYLWKTITHRYSHGTTNTSLNTSAAKNLNQFLILGKARVLNVDGGILSLFTLIREYREDLIAWNTFDHSDSRRVIINDGIITGGVIGLGNDLSTKSVYSAREIVQVSLLEATKPKSFAIFRIVAASKALLLTLVN